MKNFYYYIEFSNGEQHNCKTRDSLKNTIIDYCKKHNENNENKIYPITINQIDSLFNNRLIEPKKNKNYIKFLGKQELKNLVDIDEKRIKYYSNTGRPFSSKYIEKQKTNLIKMELNKHKDKFMDKNNYNSIIVSF